MAGCDVGSGDAACDAAAWARSGAMWLTGHPGRAPRLAASSVIASLREAASALADATAAYGRRVQVDPGALLSGRAALLGLSRRGRVSNGGSCRLLASADGWVAVSLARSEDVEMVGAVIGAAVEGDPWSALTRFAAATSGCEVAERAQLVGVPAVPLLTPLPAVPLTGPPPDRPPTVGPRPLRRQPAGPPRAGRAGRAPTVVDLSAMWAGPLCAQLLGLSGGRVIKVESSSRPDGTRRGSPEFFDWLHGGHESVVLDFGAPAGRRALARLVARADIVIESSRPRALSQLGLQPAAVVGSGRGRTWVTVSGYGRHSQRSNWVAFGDDGAAGAGLVAVDSGGRPVFCGDAIGDPIAGLYAAAAAAASYASGGGELIDVPIHDAVAHATAVPLHRGRHRVGRGPDGAWRVHCAERGSVEGVARPHRPAITAPARPMGADTERVLAELELDDAP